MDEILYIDPQPCSAVTSYRHPALPGTTFTFAPSWAPLTAKGHLFFRSLHFEASSLFPPPLFLAADVRKSLSTNSSHPSY